MAKPESQLHVRVPSELKSDLERAAQKSGRSLNSEIVQRLETSFPLSFIPMDMKEFDDAYRDATEMYLMTASDAEFMRLLALRFARRPPKPSTS